MSGAARALAGLVLLLPLASPALAGTDLFVLTIERVDLKSVSGEWVTVIEPDRRVDLINEEPTVAFFNNTGRVPEGRYVNFRVVLSETVRVQGSERSHRTREGGYAVLSGRAADHRQLPGEITGFVERSPTWNERTSGPITVVYDLDASDEDSTMELRARVDLGEPLEVRAGSFIKVWFDVPVDDAVRYAMPGQFGQGIPSKDAMYALPPGRIDEMTITVDQRVVTLSDREVTLEF